MTIPGMIDNFASCIRLFGQIIRLRLELPLFLVQEWEAVPKVPSCAMLKVLTSL